MLGCQGAFGALGTQASWRRSLLHLSGDPGRTGGLAGRSQEPRGRGPGSRGCGGPGRRPRCAGGSGGVGRRGHAGGHPRGRARRRRPADAWGVGGVTGAARRARRLAHRRGGDRSQRADRERRSAGRGSPSRPPLGRISHPDLSGVLGRASAGEPRAGARRRALLGARRPPRAHDRKPRVAARPGGRTSRRALACDRPGGDDRARGPGACGGGGGVAEPRADRPPRARGDGSPLMRPLAVERPARAGRVRRAR